MSRFYLTIFVAFFIILLIGVAYHFWPHTMDTKNLTNYPSKGTDIIAFGDSLVAGYGADTGKDFVSLLSKDIQQPVVNLGVDGETTAGALSRLKELNRYNPKVVIVLVGGNDYLQKKDMQQAFINLGKIIEDIQKRGAVVILVGVRVNYFIGNFDTQYEALVSKYKVAYVSDVLDGILGNQKYMYDSIHPNNAGYQLIADRIAPVLKQVIK
jgi:acyl-CoA thioesterase-1